MTLPIQAEPVPLQPEQDGTMHVGGTRVLLETVVAAFREGASAEQIVEHYPDLDLADAYAVITYYLRNRAAVDVYVAERCQRRRTPHQSSRRSILTVFATGSWHDVGTAATDGDDRAC